jgi:heme exporter protein B
MADKRVPESDVERAAVAATKAADALTPTGPVQVSPREAAHLAERTTVVARPDSWRQFRAILRKDISMELKTREMITSMGLYALLSMVVYFIALQDVIVQGGGSTDFQVGRIAAGLLWAAFIFMSMLGLNRSFVHEKDQGVLEALLLSPIDRPVIYFAKMIGNLIFIMIVEVLAVPVFYFLFLQGAKGLDISVWMFALALVGGSIGVAGLGTLLATLTVNTKGQDFLLTVLMVPTMFPLLYGAVTASNIALLQSSTLAAKYWTAMGFVGGFDVIMIVAAYGLYEFVIGA